MIKIIKNKEPNEWTEKKTTPGCDYDSIPELRNALLEEQGYLCAYCTCQIKFSKSKIEHLKCRAKYPDFELKYKNMVICCKGDTDGIEHCDTKKANKEISFNIFSNAFFETILYSTNRGAILSTNKTYNNEINDILNLNHKTIQRNRKTTIDGLITLLGKKKDWKKSEINKQLKKYSSRNKKNKLNPHCGILIWYLEKKLKTYIR